MRPGETCFAPLAVGPPLRSDDCQNEHSQRLVTAFTSDGRSSRSYFPYIDEPESRNLLILRVLDASRREDREAGGDAEAL